MLEYGIGVTGYNVGVVWVRNYNVHEEMIVWCLTKYFIKKQLRKMCSKSMNSRVMTTKLRLDYMNRYISKSKWNCVI